MNLSETKPIQGQFLTAYAMCILQSVLCRQSKTIAWIYQPHRWRRWVGYMNCLSMAEVFSHRSAEHQKTTCRQLLSRCSGVNLCVRWVRCCAASSSRFNRFLNDLAVYNKMIVHFDLWSSDALVNFRGLGSGQWREETTLGNDHTKKHLRTAMEERNVTPLGIFFNIIPRVFYFLMAEIQITEMEFDIKELQVVPKAHARAHTLFTCSSNL